MITLTIVRRMELQSWRDGSAFLEVSIVVGFKMSFLKVFGAFYPSPYSLYPSLPLTVFKPSGSIILTPPFTLPVFYTFTLDMHPTNGPLLFFWLLWMLHFRYTHAKFQSLSIYEKENARFIFLGFSCLTWDCSFQLHSLTWKFNSFSLQESNIPLYICTTFSLSAHHLINI